MVLDNSDGLGLNLGLGDPLLRRRRLSKNDAHLTRLLPCETRLADDHALLVVHVFDGELLLARGALKLRSGRRRFARGGSGVRLRRLGEGNPDFLAALAAIQLLAPQFVGGRITGAAGRTFESYGQVGSPLKGQQI
jgi:hypothetical protein